MRDQIAPETQHSSRSNPVTSRLWRADARHWILAACLPIYLAVALLYGTTIPIFETPDAGGHYAYIHELTEGRGLPVHGTPSGTRVTGYVAGHPPLYYALSAALSWWVPDDVDFQDWAWRNPYQTMGDADRTVNKNFLVHTPAESFPWRGTPLTVHIARLVSTLLGALAVIATYGIAVELFPQRPWISLGATALAAFNPMFVFTSARVSNDAAVTAFGSLALWGAVRLATAGASRKGLLLIGVALGLTGLSKLSGVVIAPAVALALLFDSLRQWEKRSQMPWRTRLSAIAYRWVLVGLPFLAISGWWFLRNVMLYGELMGVDAWLSRTSTVRSEPMGLLYVISELGGLEKSYWAMFGWFNVGVAPWMYRFWWVLVRASAVGLGLFLWDQLSSRGLDRRVHSGLLVLAAALLFNFASVWRFIMIVEGAQGRYLMPVVAPLSILLMLGLDRLAPSRARPLPWRHGLAATIGIAHVLLTVICLVAFILPAYATPRTIPETDLPDTMTRVDLSFDGTPITLLGGQIEADTVRAGDRVPVSLYWRAAERPQVDFFVFLQILGRDMEPIAGVDSYPGGGTFPPTLWEPGVIYRDRYELSVSAGAEVPTAGLLHAGLYTEGGERPSVISAAGQPLSDLTILDRASVRPSRPISEEVTHQVEVRFGDAITLVGYDLSAPTVPSGGVLPVTLVWRGEAALNTDYTAFIHVLDSEGTLVGQSDQLPAGGAYPTSLWLPGDVVRDQHHLTIGDGAQSGPCRLLVGMYNLKTNERLPAHKDQMRFQDDVISIEGVTIE